MDRQVWFPFHRILSDSSFLTPLAQLPSASQYRRWMELGRSRAGLLDQRLAVISSNSEERETALRALGRARSFREKFDTLISDGIESLDRLEAMGIGRNGILESIVMFAWDWRVPEQNYADALLRLGEDKWGAEVAKLKAASEFLGRARSVAVQLEYLRDHPLAALPVAGDDAASREERENTWPQGLSKLLSHPKVPGLADLANDARNAIEVVSELLRQAYPLLRTHGRPSEEKLNQLVAFHAALIVEPRVRHDHPLPRQKGLLASEQCRILAKLLNAADLPGYGRTYFGTAKVRMRFNSLVERDLWLDTISRVRRAAVGRHIRNRRPDSRDG